jgi:succinate-semialdehyde dehydrogenase / glutarate-semialdehyde dehydrogenase
MSETIEMLIGDTARHALDGRRMEVVSPANGAVVGTVPTATEADLNAAVTAAQEAFQSWSAKTAYEREKIIRQATAHVRTEAAEIGRLMALEQGKPLNQSKSEITGSCDTLDYYAAEGPRIEGYTNPTEDAAIRSTVLYQPVGVCGLLTPWNYPVALLSWKLGPALAAGCTVVVKPTPVTPLSPLAFCHALTEGGIPPGVINVVTGPGAELGAALVRHSGIAKIAMTGSTATGKKILEACTPYLKKVSLELGGHCPAVVCADADLDLAAKIIAYKGFRNMGQSCSSVNRVYAHRGIHEALVQKLRVLAEKLTIGDGITDPTVDLGPMTMADVRATVERHIADALANGATLICGGRRPDGAVYERGHYYLPTILTDATPDMLMMREETFGPVVPFAAPFDDIEDAVRQANDTAYGLVAYLFTRDYPTTVRVSEALEAGTVCVNHGAVNTNYGPYEGWKDSGFGIELGRRAIYEYLRTKHVKVYLT